MIGFLRHLAGNPGDARDDASSPDSLAVATCVLLLEAARADEDFTEEEWGHIREVVRERFGLSHEEAEALIEEAHAKRDGSPGLWQFTHALNERCSVEEKIHVLEEVWRIIYSDGVLDGHEDKLVHKLQQLLNLNHKQLIDAKLRVIGDNRSGPAGVEAPGP